ncbi:MAG: VWA domain-containing protein [Nitrosomonadales bacterium]|nr:VWA domain-containing protein [Nitrosomonadales bacterium]
MDFVYPLFLILLPLSLIPFFVNQTSKNIYSWSEMLHTDLVSRIISLFFKIVSTVIIMLIILTLSEPYADQKTILKKGKGAQIGLVLDRSASMDDPFSGGENNNPVGETKSAAASRLIVDFFNSRTDDMVGVVTFSNSAMFILPLTHNKEAIKAAVNATAGNALFQTNIGAGLTSSAELFTSIENSGSRAVILLSDGAGRIDAKTQQKIKDWFNKYQIGLYWVVLRQPGGISIFEEDVPLHQDYQLPPQVELYEFFKSFKSPFQAYEAEDPKSLERAIKDINLKEKKPIIYEEKVPGEKYTPKLLIIAIILSLMLLFLKFVEVKSLR